MSTKALSLLALLLLMKKVSLLTEITASTPLQKVYGSWQIGSKPILAVMFVWNQRESIGYLFTTFWSIPAKLSLPTRSMSKRFVARKPIKKIATKNAVTATKENAATKAVIPDFSGFLYY